MEKSIDLTQMQKLVENAEQIASAVKDSQLKPVAFEIILGFLLICSFAIIPKPASRVGWPTRLRVGLA